MTASPMSKKLTADDARQSLGAHAAATGAAIFDKYGPRIGWHELPRILEDRASVRYPCQVVFDSAPLQPGECAWASPKGGGPEDGFVIYLHPFLLTRLDRAAHWVFYQLVVVNYGGFASSADAEIFGAAALGLSREQYYQDLCDMADLLEGQPCLCGA